MEVKKFLATTQIRPLLSMPIEIIYRHRYRERARRGNVHPQKSRHSRQSRLPSASVARHRGLDRQPRDYLPPGGTWPSDPLERREGSSEARFVQIISRRLQKLIDLDGRSINRIARDANVNPQTVHNVLEGRTWCDAPTIWRLEGALRNRLWINDRLPERVEEADPRVINPRRQPSTRRDPPPDVPERWR